VIGAGLGFARAKRRTLAQLADGKQQLSVQGSSAVIDIERNKTVANRALWCFYFIICLFFLCWPVNALALLFGMFLKQKTAARQWRKYRAMGGKQ
jgi:hypothetical protein